MKVHVLFTADMSDEEVLAELRKVAKELAEGKKPEQPPSDVSSEST